MDLFGFWAGRSLRLAAGLLLLGSAVPRLPGAIEGYFKVSTVNGSSPDPMLSKWSPLLGFSVGITANSATPPVVNSSLYLTKPLDRASPRNWLGVFKGTHYADAQLLLRNSGETTPVFVLSLKSLVIRSWHMEADSSAAMLSESLDLAFASLEFSVARLDPAAGGAITSTTMAWDLATKTAVTGAAPTLTIGASGRNTIEDTPSAVTLTVGDDFTALEALEISGTSSDSSVVAPGGLAFAGTGAGRSLAVTPVANASGSATITVTVRDTAGLTTSAGFTFTVTPVNDAPVVAPVAAQTTTVGVTRAVTVDLSDIDHASATLTLTATSDNAAVLPPDGIVLTGSGASRTLTLTPAAAGSAVVTLTANDGTASSAPVTFTFIANVVGSGIPTDITLSANTVAENSADGTAIGTLGVVDADHATGHVFALIDDAGGRFRLSGAALVVNNGALLDYEAATSHPVTVRVTDPDSNTFSKQFTVTLTNVNEAPVVTLGTPGAAAPGRALALTQASVADPDAGAADVRAEFTVLHGTLTCDTTGALAGKVTGNASTTLVITAPLADLNAALTAGALTYTPAGGFIGDDILQVVCSDLGHTGTGGALSDTRLAAIKVAVDSFAAWQVLNFSDDELLDPNISGALATPRPDGLTNLLKYALGLDPHAVTTVLPQLGQNGTDWTYTYTRPAARPDLTYTVQVSTNLADWSNISVTHALLSSDTAIQTETWRATCPMANAGTIFARLQVMLSP